MKNRYTEAKVSLFIYLLSQLASCSDGAQKGKIVDSNTQTTATTTQTGDAETAGTSGTTAGTIQSATPVAPSSTPAPLGWILQPVIAGSSGTYRFGVVVDGTAAKLYFKLTGDLQTVGAIYCDEAPLTSCAQGLGQFYITEAAGEQNDYRIFNPLQQYSFTVGKQVVIVGIDAQNNVRSTSVGMLARTTATSLELNGDRSLFTNSADADGAPQKETENVGAANVSTICQCQPDFVNSRCNLINLNSNKIISWTPLITTMPCDPIFCNRFFVLGLAKQCAS